MEAMRKFSRNECTVASVTIPMASDRMLPRVCTLYLRMLRRATFRLCNNMFIFFSLYIIYLREILNFIIYDG